MTSVRQALYEWLLTLPAWQQDLARRLTRATHLDGEQLDEARRVVFAAYGVLDGDENAPEPSSLSIDDLPGADNADEAARLVQLSHLRGVGIVADDQTLRFGEAGLTVVYGPNGAGKSTYVGALKCICRTVDLNTGIRGNVFDAATPSPTANVEYLNGADRRAQQINLHDPEPVGLDVVSVFDSHCAELYLDRQNSVAFVPSSLHLLARLATAQDALRREVDSEVGRLQRTRATFPEIQLNTAARARVESLSSTTDVEELKRFAELTDVEHARLDEIRAALAAAEARNAGADADAARQEASRAREAIRKLGEMADRVSDESCQRIRSVVTERDSALEAVNAAASEFEALPRPSIGHEPWKRLWQAAREFVESGAGAFPPTEGETCPLCLQLVGEDAADRFQHFEQHVRSQLQEHAKRAELAATAILEQLDPDVVPARSDVISDDAATRQPELAQKVQAARDAIEDRMRSLSEDPTVTILTQLTDIPDADVAIWANERDAHADLLLAATDVNGEQELRREAAEFEARRKLLARIGDVESEVETITRLDRLAQLRSALATNRITTKQRELSATAVTGALSSALTSELEHLRCHHLPVDVEPHTAAGETQVVLRLAGAHGTPRVSEILSEGEQRAVALAFFFAETGLAEHTGGIVVDDPVSSLDDERRAYIARRLVSEAMRRQVIVFTHDLPFMLDLLEQAEKASLEPQLQGIWRHGGSVGRIDESPPFATLKFKQRVGALEDRVQHWEEQPEPRDADEAWHRVCDFYADMRTTWERGVEERLFNGVVQRFQREVKTLKLRSVEINSERVEAVDEGMTRCSYFVHDAPSGTRTALPSRADLARDVEKLRAFERTTRDR